MSQAVSRACSSGWWALQAAFESSEKTEDNKAEKIERETEEDIEYYPRYKVSFQQSVMLFLNYKQVDF